MIIAAVFGIAAAIHWARNAAWRQFHPYGWIDFVHGRHVR